MHKTILVYTLALLTARAGAQGTGPETRARLKGVEEEVPVRDITEVGGFAGGRIHKNEANYLDTFDIAKYVALIQDPQTTAWDWKPGEQPGKWLEASILATQRSNDKALEDKARDMYARILKAQAKDGYVGVTSPAVRTPDKPLRGMDAYELYFLLHALLTGYEEWHDPKGLIAAERLADYFLKYIGPGKAGFWPGDKRPPENKNATYKGTQHSDIAGHSIHYGWEGTLLIDPVMRLYELSGDKRYLGWCRWVVGQIDTWSGWDAYTKIGRMPINDVQPYVHAHTFQMNFLGFLRLYRATGDTALLHKVEAAWADVAGRQLYVTGGVSVGEHYERGYVKPLTGKMLETCATMSWMQLSQALLELTGDTKYADVLERALWNQVFAAQAIDGNANRYNTPPDGVVPEGYFREPDCCSGSGERLEAMLPSFVYATGGADTLFVNQFMASKANVHLKTLDVALTQVTDYPSTGANEITLQPAKPATFTVAVRIPAWCTAPSIQINGAPITDVEPGKYRMIRRRWAAGDKITLDFPMHLQWLRHEHYEQTSDKKPYKTSPDPDAPYALVRGPLVYAADDIWYTGAGIGGGKPGAGLFGRVKYVLADPSKFAQAPTEPDMLGPGYVVPFQEGGRAFSMNVYPFANIGKWYRDGAHKPGKDSAAYAYAVWLKGTPPKDVILPKVLSSHMVLQRQRPVPIWGKAAPGETVTVTFAGQQKRATADENGAWSLALDPMEASATPRSLTVKAKDAVTLTDILVGEVWLCSGQSNMEYTMMKNAKFEDTKRYPSPKGALDSANDPAIRIFLVLRDYAKPGAQAAWDTAKGRALRTFSAAGYFFAKSLYDHLHVPIGMIDASISGSNIEPWLPGDKGKFYNDMIHPLAPYALKGFLWYQGETNCFLGETTAYTAKMRTLIDSWRGLWGDATLPFYYVQLPPFTYSGTKGLTDQTLPEFREAQAKVLSVPHTGMIVTTDLADDPSELHPPYKWMIGRRLALQALAKTYGQDVICDGPVYSGMEVKKNAIEITFGANGGLGGAPLPGASLVSIDGQPLTGFTIAGPDGHFVPATARIKGDKVVVTGVHHPRAVRFAWNETAQPNLFNRAGLPAMPFRTDQHP